MTNIKSTSKLSRLEEVQEEELRGGQDDPMPQLTSPESSSTPRRKYQDEAVQNGYKTPLSAPKPRTQASYHLENEDQITLTEHEVQSSNLYQDDVVTSKAPQRKSSLLTALSKNEDSTSEEVINSDEEPGKSTDKTSVHYSSASSVGSDVEY